MRKIPTLFVRHLSDRKYVRNEVTPGCEWVQWGEGVATRKFDGTCVLIRNGVMFKRHEVKSGKTWPLDFEQVGHDETTGKTVGWVPVGDGPEDRWHREAVEYHRPEDGTYELVGPKIQGNPEGFKTHLLIPHGLDTMEAPVDFDDLRAFLTDLDFTYEGIVWHHPDGRMAKLKKRDFPRGDNQ